MTNEAEVIRIKASIYDVAKKANVSIATVSLAINGKKGVGEATRKRVVNTAMEMGYRIETVAAFPGKRKIVMLMSKPDSSYFNSSFYSTTMEYFCKSIDPYPFEIVIKITSHSREKQAVQELAHDNAIFAVLFFSIRLTDAEVHCYLPHTPCIFFNRAYVSESNSYAVCLNNYKSCYLITHHLTELGHRDIAFMGYVGGVFASEERLHGYREAMEEAGAPYISENIISVEHLPELGYMAVRKMLMERVKMPSAIVCSNDFIAIGAMEALLDAGIGIPSEISLAAVHNVQQNLHLLKVPMTTVSVDHSQMGDEAAQKLIALYNGETPGRCTIFDGKLIVRASTGAPPIRNEAHT